MAQIGRCDAHHHLRTAARVPLIGPMGSSTGSNWDSCFSCQGGPITRIDCPSHEVVHDRWWQAGVQE